MTHGAGAGDLRTRLRLWRATPGRGPRGIVWLPAPRGVGSERKGAQILAGTWHLAGEVIEAPGALPWDLTPGSTPFEMMLHGQGWLDDVMAAGRAGATERARDWVLDWARRYGGGRGPGWSPSLTGRRLLRWISHAPALLTGLADTDRGLLLQAIYAQAGYLARHSGDAAPGLPRLEALVGLLYGGLTLDGQARMADIAVAGLERALGEDVDAEGGIEARNPEALLEVAILLGWAIDALRARGPVPRGLASAQARIVPTLRALTHADITLARFHGGGPGREGRLAQVPASSDRPARGDGGLAMGFLTMAQGGTTLIADAAPPPTGPVSGSAHASTLAFELTSGSCPVVVNCGPGGAFGRDWHRAGRATASHSTLSLDGWSTARIGPLIEVDGRRVAPLVQPPGRVQWSRSDGPEGSTAIMAHDGYGPGFGLTHLRRLVLSTDGGNLSGEDALRATTAADKERLQAARLAAREEPEDGLTFRIRFHLHPDAEAGLEPDGRAVTIACPSGEAWLFRMGDRTRGDGAARAALSLEPSVHLDPARLHPRPARQVVLSGRVLTYAATIDWTLTRIRATTDPAARPDDQQGRPPT